MSGRLAGKVAAITGGAAIPAMRAAGGGSIVNIASIRSAITSGGTLQYDTTKAAVVGLTRGLARFGVHPLPSAPG